MLKYHEQLQHPYWQRKRLEIMQRDNFTCTVCGSTKRTLTVHHLCYLPETHAWEYDDELMVTICKKCHSEITFDLAKVAGLIAWHCLKSNIDLTTIIETFKRLNNGTNKDN